MRSSSAAAPQARSSLPSCRPRAAAAKRILIIEAGGPTSATIGGTDYPPWLPAGRTDLTILDVPGEYSLMAFQRARHAVSPHRHALHLARHRTRRQLSVQRDAVPDQPVGDFRPGLAGRMAFDRHGALLPDRPPECPGDEYTIHRRRPAEHRTGDDHSPALRRQRMGRGRHKHAHSTGREASTAGHTSRPPTAGARDRSADISRQSIRRRAGAGPGNPASSPSAIESTSTPAAPRWL